MGDCRIMPPVGALTKPKKDIPLIFIDIFFHNFVIDLLLLFFIKNVNSGRRV